MAEVNEKTLKPKILIVEDDKFLADLLIVSFQKEGLDFELVPDAESALARLEEIKPDLIVLDLVLPHMDGFELLEKVKADKNLASIPVVILSNLGQEEEVKRGLRLGAEDYLIKAHHDMDEIIQKINRVLKK